VFKYELEHGAVTPQVLGVVLLVCLGVMLGASWITLALQPMLRRQAEERRRLNEEWSVLRTARRQRGTCPRCGSRLSERDWYHKPTVIDDRLDDD
jgi:uncharacterized paraquat-inducible protein A